MRIKSYFAHTVEDAMSMARQELGTDAMLVNTRKAPPESCHLGEYEVVFATDLPAEENSLADSAGALPAESAAAFSGSASFAREFADLKKELEGMRRTLQRGAFGSGEWGGSEGFAMLLASDMDPELAREVMQAAEARLQGSVRAASDTDPAFERALAEELESRMTIQAALGRGETTPRIVALVGPPGGGKTTTLVKLAVNHGLTCRRPVLLLAMDNYRVAASEQLRSFAAILGVGFQFVDTVGALVQAIEENRGKEYIFIDTPGFGYSDFDVSKGLAQFLATRADIDTHLVLPASMRSADLARMANRYEAFRPNRLLFTKLDETGSLGAVFQEAARSARPLSFFATGQRIPEDLETASTSRLLESILGGTRSAALSAA